MRDGYELVSNGHSSPTFPRYQSEDKYGLLWLRRRSSSRYFVYISAFSVVILLTLVIVRGLGYHAGDIYIHVVGSSSKHGGTATVNAGKLESSDSFKVVTPEAYTLSPELGANMPITFIPYTFGYAMLKQTLKVYQRAQWRNIVVIDNSWNRDAWNDEELLKELGVLQVVLTTTHMRFSQMMSTIDTFGSLLGHEYYMWSHSDVFLISPSASPSSFDLVTTCISHRLKTQKDLGVVFFHYDWLSMVRVEAANAAPWDPAMMQYGSDCDRYSRMRQAGYRVVESREDDECPETHQLRGELFNMNGILSDEELAVVLSEDAPFEERMEVVRHAEDNFDQYSWRAKGKGAMATADSKAFDSYALGGHQYYRDKWGQDMGVGCVLDDVKNNFDIPPTPPRVVGIVPNREDGNENLKRDDKDESS